MDPDCASPPCYLTIQEAVEAASHGDEVFVMSGTYDEQVRIAPPETNPPQFTLTPRASSQTGSAPVTVRHTETNQDQHDRDAVFEIYDYSNEAGRPMTASEDMQGTIEGFEIIGGGTAAIYDPYGELYPTWPQFYGNGAFRGQPLVADLDGDIDLEIFAGANRPYIWALEQDGSNVEGWPYYSDDQNFGTGALADLDEDGDTDIVFQGYDAKIHVFDTAGKWDYKRIECGTWLYDNWHTGAYHKDLYREAESATSMIGFETVADTSAWGHGAIRFAADETRTKTITSTTEIKAPATLHYRTEVPVWDEYSLWVRIRRDGASAAESGCA